DVLRADPDEGVVNRRRAVVTPARERGLAFEGIVASVAVLRPQSFGGNVNIARAGNSIESRIRRSRKMVVSHQRESDHTSAGRSHTNRRMEKVIVSQSQITLLDNNASHSRVRDLRANHKVGDARLDAMPEIQSSVQRSPQLAVCIDDLSHGETGSDLRL